MICKSCNREIEGSDLYLSKQVGMEGHYHWKCFVALCRKANKIGTQSLEGTVISSGVYESTTPSGVEKEPIEND